MMRPNHAVVAVALGITALLFSGCQPATTSPNAGAFTLTQTLSAGTGANDSFGGFDNSGLSFSRRRRRHRRTCHLFGYPHRRGSRLRTRRRRELGSEHYPCGSRKRDALRGRCRHQRRLCRCRVARKRVRLRAKRGRRGSVGVWCNVFLTRVRETYRQWR